MVEDAQSRLGKMERSSCGDWINEERTGTREWWKQIHVQNSQWKMLIFWVIGIHLRRNLEPGSGLRICDLLKMIERFSNARTGVLSRCARLTSSHVDSSVRWQNFFVTTVSAVIRHRISIVYLIIMIIINPYFRSFGSPNPADTRTASCR